MNPTRLETQAVRRFTCLGAECPDTCCQGWGMQVTAETVAQYTKEAPELLAAVNTGEAGFIMKRSADTGACVKLDQGFCAIQRDYGTDFLSDACYFYPRIARALGDVVVMGAALSCPQALQLMLGERGAFDFGGREEVRIPYHLRNYLPEGLDPETALAIHQAFLAIAGDEQFSAAYNFMRVSAVARAIEMQPVGSWFEALPLCLSMVEGRIPHSEISPVDPFNLVQALHGLMSASQSARPRLNRMVDALAERLGILFHPIGGIQLTQDAPVLAVRLLSHMRSQAPMLQTVLRRYLQAQLSQALFPFAGLGHNLSERTSIIGVRFATTRLALGLLPDSPSDQEIVMSIQVLARFLDHLSDADLSLQIYRETGWTREARLRAIVGE